MTDEAVHLLACNSIAVYHDSDSSDMTQTSINCSIATIDRFLGERP